MRRRNTVFWSLICSAPLAIGLALFLGDGWRDPLALFAPERAGILEIRLWRVALGALVGATLAAAGAVLQAVLRNPLADPYVLGLSAGAGLGAAGCIVAGGATLLAGLLLPLAGFAGALLRLLAGYRLARIGPRTTGHTLILAGVVWGALCGSLLMFIVSQSSAAGLHAIMWWFLGDLQVYDVRLVVAAAVLAGGALAQLMRIVNHLNALTLGEEMAGHVGLNPERARLTALALAAVLTAVAVAVSGLIGFVGLVVPHAVRALVGPDHRRLLPAAALVGAAFLALADGLGRMLLFPVEIPVGVITSIAGAPFFLFLLRRRPKEIWS